LRKKRDIGIKQVIHRCGVVAQKPVADEIGRRPRIGVDIDLRVLYPVGVQKLLGSPAITAPGSGIHLNCHMHPY